MKFLIILTTISISMMSNSVQARCMVFQGVNWCDNGNSQIDRADGLYTLIGKQLHVEYYRTDYYYDNYYSGYGYHPRYTYYSIFDHDLGNKFTEDVSHANATCSADRHNRKVPAEQPKG